MVITKFNCKNVILDLKKEFEPMARDKGIILNICDKCCDKEIIIESDLSRVKQIITNLIGNAIKFTQIGTIELGLSENDEGVIFHVKDTGIGIPDEFKNHVFERFQQAEKTKSRNYGGNGLGLAISKNLIDIMGGKIWFESEVGKGTTFFFFLPS